MTFVSSTKLHRPDAGHARRRLPRPGLQPERPVGKHVEGLPLREPADGAATERLPPPSPRPWTPPRNCPPRWPLKAAVAADAVTRRRLRRHPRGHLPPLPRGGRRDRPDAHAAGDRQSRRKTDAHATLTFETTTGAQTQLAWTCPARSRRTVDLSTVPELAGASFSTLLESDRELALDRLISFGARRCSAASLETAVDQPAATWYFAEGSTVDPQELFYLVQNPGATEARVEVRYLLPNGAAPVVRTHVVAPGSRATIWVDRENPALASTDVAAEITSVDGTPIVVERSSYVRQEGSAAPRGGDSAPASRLPPRGGSSTARPASTRRGCSSPTRVVKPPRCAPTYQRADGRSLHPVLHAGAEQPPDGGRRERASVAHEHDARHHRRGERADCRRAHHVVGRQRRLR